MDRTYDIFINSEAQLPLCYWGINLEQDIGFEPMTFSLATKHSTTELIPHICVLPSGLSAQPTAVYLTVALAFSFIGAVLRLDRPEGIVKYTSLRRCL